MPPMLKRAGQPIDYIPWLELVAAIEDSIDLTLADADVEEEWREWLAGHFDEPEDVVFGSEKPLWAGVRIAGRALPVQRQPVTGVVGIRSFLR